MQVYQKIVGWKPLVLTIVAGLCLCNSVRAAVFYIDPSQTANGTGTISNPYKSLPAISANNTYLFKAGTTYNISATISVTADNVTFGSYGAGVKPKIYNGTNSRRTIEFRGRNGRLTGLSFEMYANVPNGNTDAGSGTGNVALLWDSYGVKRPYSLTIDNCVIVGGKPGIDAHGCSSVRVLNCDISNAVYDAQWSDRMDTVIYKNTWVHDMYLNEGNSNLVISIDLLHIKHCFKLMVENCILDHTNTPGKYCIIHHKDDLSTYARDSLIVTNTELRGSQNSLNYGACVKPSDYYASFKNCIFTDAIRHMQDVGNNLEVDNCLFRSVIPESGQICGIQKNNYAEVKNSSFIGIKSPYSGNQATGNCIFRNCTGSGNYTNAPTDPQFDENYTATAASLVGVGYVATGAGSPDVTAPSATSGLNYNNVTSESIGLSWAASTDDKGVARYTVYADGIEIASTTGTSTSLTGFAPGTVYSITVKARDAAGNLSDAGEELLVTTLTTGQTVLSESSQVEIYPNPAHDFITADVTAKSEIRILDGSGKLVVVSTVEPGTTRLPLSLKPGFYIFGIVVENKQTTWNKLIVK